MFTYNITSDLINNDSLEKTEQKSDISKDQNHRINCNSSILLIGNGFDLRAKIKSSFKDFLLHIIYTIAIHNYLDKDLFPNFEKSLLIDYVSSEKCPNNLRQIYRRMEENHISPISSYIDFAKSKFGTLLLSKLLPNLYDELVPKREVIKFFNGQTEFFIGNSKPLYPLYSIYGLSNEKSETEDFLKDISPQKLGKNVETFVILVDEEIAKNKQIDLWLDVESVIEMVVTNSEELKEKYGFKENTSFITDNASVKNYLKGLDLFEELLAYYLKEEEKSLDNTSDNFNNFFNNIQNNYLESLNKRSHLRIQDFDISNPSIVINYNYTKVAKKLFQANGSFPKIHYVNGSLEIFDDIKVNEIKTNIVIGYTPSVKTSVQKDLYPFEKISRRVIKNTEYINIDALIGKCLNNSQKNGSKNDRYFELTILGHSCGLADSDILKPLLSSKYLKTAVILCHSVKDLISIYNNIRSMLDETVFNELMTYSPNKDMHNLYFSVENE